MQHRQMPRLRHRLIQRAVQQFAQFRPERHVKKMFLLQRHLRADPIHTNERRVHAAKT
jgi:hypothetical protein